jgi:hypothetical protein
MPSRSEKQRKYLYARFGAAWVKRHHFHVVKPKRKKAKKTRKKRK